MGKVDRVAQVIVRWFALLLILMGVAPIGGCRICADCEDIAYPAYGGSWQRTRRDGGRVGSIFDPAGAKTTELVPRNSPASADELERIRQKDRVPQVIGPDDQMPDDESIPPKSREDEDDLRQRSLDDMQEDTENELQRKELKDINVVPGEQMPPMLR